MCKQLINRRLLLRQELLAERCIFLACAIGKSSARERERSEWIIALIIIGERSRTLHVDHDRSRLADILWQFPPRIHRLLARSDYVAHYFDHLRLRIGHTLRGVAITSLVVVDTEHAMPRQAMPPPVRQKLLKGVHVATSVPLALRGAWPTQLQFF